MPVLRININGRYYDITCEKNKEKYVLELSKYFDEKIKNLSSKLKNVDHSRLLVFLPPLAKTQYHLCRLP